MADDVVEPAGGEAEADESPVADTDVTDLPLDESPEAHIRRAMAGADAESSAADAPEEDPAEAPEAPAAEPGG
jgi:hypothetical protein